VIEEAHRKGRRRLHPRVAVHDLHAVLLGRFLVEMPHVEVEVLLRIQLQHLFGVFRGIRFGLGLRSWRSSSPSYPPCWYGSRHRIMVRSETPIISTVSHDFKLLAIAFKITSCTFYHPFHFHVCRRLTPSAFYPCQADRSHANNNHTFFS